MRVDFAQRTTLQESGLVPSELGLSAPEAGNARDNGSQVVRFLSGLLDVRTTLVKLGNKQHLLVQSAGPRDDARKPVNPSLASTAAPEN
jgi:hypothetical protein